MFQKRAIKYFSTYTVLILSLGLSACSKDEDESTSLSSGSTVSCSVTGTVASGNLNTSYSSIVVSNLVVNSSGGSGSYVLTFPTGATGTVGSYYAGTGSLTLTTGYSGGVNAQFSIRDTSDSSNTGTCYLVLSGSSSTSVGTASLALTTSNSAPSIGTSVSIYATASNISDPVYTFSYVGSIPSGATGSYSGSTMTLTSPSAGTITISSHVVSSSNSALYADAQIVINYGGTSTTTSSALTCTLAHQSGAFYSGSSIGFYITSNTGEALRMVYWEPGEPWDNGIAPTFPISLSQSGVYNYFYANYSYNGVKYVRILAESLSRPGTFCNSGAYLTDTVTIY